MLPQELEEQLKFVNIILFRLKPLLTLYRVLSNSLPRFAEFMLKRHKMEDHNTPKCRINLSKKGRKGCSWKKKSDKNSKALVEMKILISRLPKKRKDQKMLSPYSLPTKKNVF